MFNSYTIIEKWRGQIQTLSEALSLSYAKEYSSIDKIVQKELVDPIWNRIVRLGNFTSKRQDRVYFDYTTLPSQSEPLELIHTYAPYVRDLCVYLEMAILLKSSGIDFIQTSSTEIEKEVKNIMRLEPEIRNEIDILLNLNRDKKTGSDDNSIYLPKTKVTWDLKTEMITEPTGKHMKIGKYVEFLLKKYLIPFVNPGLAELNTKLKQAYQKYTTRKSQAGVPTRRKEFYIVISRHPYDLAGMGTGRGWESCMNIEDGSNRRFVECDIQQGTFIAYLVNKYDLNINKPIGRVLIKPYYHEYDATLLYRPEKKEYGSLPSTFTKDVTQILDKAHAEQILPIGRYNLEPSLYKDTLESEVYRRYNTEADKWRILYKDLNVLEFYIESFNTYLSHIQNINPFQDKDMYYTVVNDKDVNIIREQINRIRQQYWTFLYELFGIENYERPDKTGTYPPWYDKRAQPIPQENNELDRFSKVLTIVITIGDTIEKIINILDSNLEPYKVQTEVNKLTLILHKQIDNMQSLLFGDIWLLKNHTGGRGRR